MATFTDKYRVYWEGGKGGILTIEQNTAPFASYLHIHETEVPQIIEMLAEALNEQYRTPVQHVVEPPDGD